MALDYIPTLREEDYDEFMESYSHLIQSRRQGILAQSRYVEEKNRLFSEFFSKLAPEDVRLFPSIDGLRDLLLQIMSEQDAEYWTKHELDHGKKALTLGYSVQYGAYLMRGQSGNLIVVPFTNTLEDTVSSELDQIKSAPDHMSVYDKL